MTHRIRLPFSAKGLVRWLSNDGLYMVLSILIAGVLWGFLHFQQSAQVSIALDVRWIAVPEDHMILAGDLPPIRVTLDGPGTLLRQIESRGLAYEVDADNMVEGSNLLRVDVSRLKLPRGVLASRVSPSSFEVEYLPVEERILPVKVIFQGSVMGRYKLGVITLEPRNIAIVVRKGQLDGAHFLYTKPLNLSSHAVTFSSDVNLDLGGLDVKKISADTVSVRVEINPETGEKTYAAVPVGIKGISTAGLELIPDQVSVTLMGSVADLEGAEGLLQTWVNLKRFPGKPTALLVEMTPPENLTLVSIVPKLVVVGEKRD